MTSTASEAASYEFTTLTCIPGVIEVSRIFLPFIEGSGKKSRRVQNSAHSSYTCITTEKQQYLEISADLCFKLHQVLSACNIKSATCSADVALLQAA